MAYDEALAARIRRLLGRRADVTERRMFGGVAFMVRGHLCCGIVGRDLVVRVGREAYPAALARRHARPMDFTGRPLTGMVYVAPAGCRTAAGLRAWIEPAVRLARGRPPKGSVTRTPRGPGPGREEPSGILPGDLADGRGARPKRRSRRVPTPPLAQRQEVDRCERRHGSSDGRGATR